MVETIDNTNENRPIKGSFNEENITYFQLYLTKKHEILPLLFAIIIILNIIAMFLTTTFSFTEIFLYSGIITFGLIIIAILLIIDTRNFFWVIINAVILNLILIEILILFGTAHLDLSSLILAIITSILLELFALGPFFIIETIILKKESIKDVKNK